MNSKVYRCWDEERACFTALKTGTELLSEEAFWLERLQEFPVPEFYGLTSRKGRWVLSMKYCIGRTFHEMLKEQAVPFEQGILLVTRWCRILQDIHRKYPGYIFCDLKPSNLMIAPDGTVTLIDFESIYPIGTIQEVHATGYYAAPELREGCVEKRTEIYSIGKILEQLDEEVHPVFRHLIVRPCLQRKPSERPSMNLLIHELTWYGNFYVRLHRIPAFLSDFMRYFVEISLCFCLILAGYVIIEFTLW